MLIGFDLDGTLIDSVGSGWEAFIKAIDKHGLDVSSIDVKKFNGSTLTNTLRRIKKDITDDEIHKIVQTKNKIEENLGKIKAFPDTVSTILQLRKKAELAIMSNTHFPIIMRRLDETGINPMFFETIIGSDLVNHPKPFPDEINLVEKLIHHKVDFFVGDTVTDIKTGNAAGVKTVILRNELSDMEEIKRHKPYKIINNLSELVSLV
ncbi:HAD-IA family hydrolase [Candidatus Woesearchaeota archaeon]|nr:HAD-IA family hydrolase [Candidatus Woesearchaeota archaeon]